MVKRAFRQGASFGKRIQFWIIAEMIRSGLDVYIPLVDDMGVDAVVRKSDGAFLEVQIKARSRHAKNGTQFVVRSVPGSELELRENYWFVFYSEPLDKMWIMKSAEFIREAGQDTKGKYKGLRFIKFNGKRKKFQEYEVPVGDFSRIKGAYRAVLPVE
jgi:hypothetical protein